MTQVRLLLTSAGITNEHIRKALVDLLGKPINQSTALFVPTAIYAYPNGSNYAWISLQSLGNLGWNKFILQRWIRKMARNGKDSDAYTEISARIGTLAHYFAEQYMKEEPIDPMAK